MTRANRLTAQKPDRSGSRSSWLWEKHSPGLICLGLALVTLAAYLGVLHNGFVNYDDPDYVTSNKHVLGGISWESLKWAFTTGHASNWHPLTWISHMLDCQLFGQTAAGHHLVSVAFHFANTIVLFLLLRRMTGERWPSALVAALFGWHPLHVESVAWVSERKDVLSTFFLLLTLASYAHYARERASSSPLSNPAPRQDRLASKAVPIQWGPAGRAYTLALVWFVLGLLSKPMLVTTPFLLLLLDYWPLRRLQADSTVAFVKAFGWRCLEKVPFFALSLVSSVVTFLVQREGGAVSASLTLTQRINNALVSYVRYILKSLWPVDLSVLYPHPGSWPVWNVVAAGFLLLVITTVACLSARRRPYMAMGWFWFLGTLIPVIGLIQVGIQSMADRYSYVPAIGLFIIVAWGGLDLFGSKINTRVLLGCVGVALVGCVLLTARQVTFWRTSETLFARAVEVTSRNYLAYNNLGFYLAGEGRVEEAMRDYQKALEINPLYEDALNNLGYSLAGLKRHAEAIPLYEAALRIKPDHVEVHNNLGNALSEVGRLPEAISHYEFVLKRKPDHADAHNNLGIALAMQGKLDEALNHFRAAIQFKPDYASAHSNLGNGLAAQHRFQEAIAEYRESLRLNPGDPQAHNNLGNVLAEQNRLEEAIPQYLEAIRLNSDNPEAEFNLALAYARQGKRAEAIAHCQTALRLNPLYPNARKELDLLLNSPSPSISTTNAILSR